MQERIENHWLGRGVISCLIVVVLAAIVLPNLPAASSIGREQARLTRPLAGMTGLHQGWAMFAAIDRVGSFYPFAEIHFADGSTVTWRPPPEGKLLTYRHYRWRSAASDVWRSRPLQAEVAAWLAERYREPDREPVEVVFKRRFAATPRIGSDAARSWTVSEVSRFAVGGAR